jgi:hypothetical protein
MEQSMAEVRLSAIRIGFPYTVEIDFPAGFLQAGESVRTKFRKYAGDPNPVVATDDRVGDAVTWELTEAQTAAMESSTYVCEAEVYDTAAPELKGTILTNNRYIADCYESPSE